jgi:SAM-dependent methyltransferase
LTVDVKTFWNSRADFGPLMGTRDVIAKRLEIEAIAKHVSDGARVLDAGCGNGLTAIELARRFRIDMLGIDFGEALIGSAESLAAGVDLRGTVEFRVADVQDDLSDLGLFDLVYTERTLINLPDWDSQRAALRNLCTRVRVGGAYLMCENSQDGVDELNALRRCVGLDAIVPPWHNRYLRDCELATFALPGVTLERIVYYSSTYYFLSRIVNASVAASEGREPDYESPINLLALDLPAIGNLGQGRIWIWRRVA